VERLERDAAALVRVREVARQPLGDGRKVGIRGGEADAGLHAPDRPKVIRPPRGRRPALDRDESPDLRAADHLRFLRDDADDRPLPTVQPYLPADHVRVRSEARPPARLAQHHEVAARAVVLGKKGPAHGTPQGLLQRHPEAAVAKAGGGYGNWFRWRDIPVG
jgi:hypothetical protein